MATDLSCVLLLLVVSCFWSSKSSNIGAIILDFESLSRQEDCTITCINETLWLYFGQAKAFLSLDCGFQLIESSFRARCSWLLGHLRNHSLGDVQARLLGEEFGRLVVAELLLRGDAIGSIEAWWLLIGLSCTNIIFLLLVLDLDRTKILWFDGRHGPLGGVSLLRWLCSSKTIDSWSRLLSQLWQINNNLLTVVTDLLIASSLLLDFALNKWFRGC